MELTRPVTNIIPGLWFNMPDNFQEEYPFNEVKKTHIQAINKHLKAVRKMLAEMEPGLQKDACSRMKSQLRSASELVSRYV